MRLEYKAQLSYSLICAYIGCVHVLVVASRTPSNGLGYPSRFHALLPWFMSVKAYSNYVGYLLVLDKFYEV